MTKTEMLELLKDTLCNSGWRVDHTSERDGRATSYYLSRVGDLTGKTTIRISDHDLGYKNGEPQGGHWAADITVNPDISLADHIEAVSNEDYRESFDGFACGYGLAEYRADHPQ